MGASEKLFQQAVVTCRRRSPHPFTCYAVMLQRLLQKKTSGSPANAGAGAAARFGGAGGCAVELWLVIWPVAEQSNFPAGSSAEDEIEATVALSAKTRRNRRERERACAQTPGTAGAAREESTNRFIEIPEQNRARAGAMWRDLHGGREARA